VGEPIDVQVREERSTVVERATKPLREPLAHHGWNPVPRWTEPTYTPRWTEPTYTLTKPTCPPHGRADWVQTRTRIGE
jgi:hypothetical protein